MSATRPAREPRFDHGRRRQAIVRAVLTDVFQNRVRAGERLVTQTLADRFGVSHTPIREALIELAGIGVVDLLPNRGAVVRRVAARDVQDVCQVRRALECEAVRAACGRIGPTDLREVEAAVRPLAADDRTGPAVVAVARATDNRFHDLIAGSCGNKYLEAELGRLKILFRVFRDVAWEQEEARRDFHRVAVEAREHLAVLDALIANDPDAAVAAMADHIRSGEHYWSRVTARLTET
jgi:DNA-binding GntR family transcriptional regulator